MHAVIVDDERRPAEYLAGLLSQCCPQITSTTIYNDAEVALKHLSTQTPGMLFLDIEMPGMTGFELLEMLPDAQRPPVVFTTAHNTYAMRAFEVAAVHYLLKPIDPTQLIEAVGRIADSSSGLPGNQLTALLTSYRSEQATINLPDGQDYHIIPIRDIVRVKGQGSYAEFHLRNGRSITVSKRLKVYAEKLSAHDFIRPHQSHLVNRACIVRYSRADGGFLELSDGTSVPVSAKMRLQLKASLGVG